MTDAAERVTLGRKVGSDEWSVMQPGETMSMGYAEAENYTLTDIHDSCTEGAAKTISKQAAEIAALRAQLADARKVKDLAFEEYNLTGQFVDGFELLKRSLNRSYNYWLSRRVSDGFFMVRFDQSSSYQIGGATEEEAIRNTQDEHERRILSALEGE